MVCVFQKPDYLAKGRIGDITVLSAQTWTQRLLRFLKIIFQLFRESVIIGDSLR